MPVSPQSIVGAVLEELPETLPVFIVNRMHCPGCVMAPFMTLAEAADSHRLDLDTLLDELRAAIAAGTVTEDA
ncbi:MAG TPA: DUF1858 domain-containing protein [Paracoccaceae bacterium]|nr:DUF1858 domain-containing protein [Paracoccaceae bacterium]